MSLILGDSLEVIRGMASETIDAIVTDPPYMIDFMGKEFDRSKDNIAASVDFWRECLRVLKPGAHLLAFGGARTYHRMAVAIEDAGFEIRDMIEWIYASGFPKSQNVAKMLAKKNGEDVPIRSDHPNYKKPEFNNGLDGLGTALKPAHEPLVLARKPLSEATVLDNVTKHGTGAIEIDGCRIPIGSDKATSRPLGKSAYQRGGKIITHGEPGDRILESEVSGGDAGGRFPANVICQDDALNDGETTRSMAGIKNLPTSNIYGGSSLRSSATMGTGEITGFSDEGSKSRYFDLDLWNEKHGLLQFPKPGGVEKNTGCEDLEDSLGGSLEGGNDKRRGQDKPQLSARKNSHPTVKPVPLMLWLVKLISREGQTVLDPFCGSGTTGVACHYAEREFVGIEISPEYLKIAEARIKGALMPLERGLL